MSDRIFTANFWDFCNYRVSGRGRPFWGARLLHCYALREIARFINIAAELDCKVISEELKRNHGQDRHHALGRFWQRDSVVGELLELFCTASAGERNDRSFTRFDLFDVIQVLRKDRIVGYDKNRRKIGTNECDDTVLELGAGMAFGEKVSDLFHF